MTDELILLHELYNSLLSTGIIIEGMDDVEAVKSIFREHCLRFGVDLNVIDYKNNNMQGINQQIMRFIQLKKAQHEVDIELILDIGYYSDYKKVDLQQLMRWLGTLLDNAFDATEDNPIYIRIVVTSKRVSLSVANEYAGERNQDFNAMFEKGYSTKSEGRGLGLYYLQQTVSELGGCITCFEEYHEAHDCYYLTFLLEFSNNCLKSKSLLT